VFQVSLKRSLNVAEHLRFGEALASLRDEGVLVIGSGHTTHNIGDIGFQEDAPSWAKTFVDFIHKVLVDPQLTPEQRKAKLLAVEQEPTFRKAHPRAEHFLPMVVAAAAAGYEAGKVAYEEFLIGSLFCSHLKFS
jgi:aromatic ring-opening dioxygenase catalytic subunit (LigB family)